MDLNTSEFDHITDRLTDAMTRPLMKRIEELEGENKELHEVLEKANHTMAVQTLALNGAQQKIAGLSNGRHRFIFLYVKITVFCNTRYTSSFFINT